MNGQYLNESIKTVEIVERADLDTKSSETYSDPFAGKVSVDPDLIHETPMAGTVPAVGPANVPLADVVPDVVPIKNVVVVADGSLTALLSREESELFRTRWNEIQGKFVDDPRSAVQQADGLVSEVIEKITQMFANEHSSLDGEWNQGVDVSTEDLRKALQHYRSFFNRMVV